VSQQVFFVRAGKKRHHVNDLLSSLCAIPGVWIANSSSGYRKSVEQKPPPFGWGFANALERGKPKQRTRHQNLLAFICAVVISAIRHKAMSRA
jgi:hypothetical protein